MHKVDPLKLDAVLIEQIAQYRRAAKLRREEGEPVLASYLDRRRLKLAITRKGLIRKRIRDSVPRPDT